MKRSLSLLLTLLLFLALLPPGTAAAEDRVVLTIGDVEDRSGSRMDGEDQLGLWQYLEDQLRDQVRLSDGGGLRHRAVQRQSAGHRRHEEQPGHNFGKRRCVQRRPLSRRIRPQSPERGRTACL